MPRTRLNLLPALIAIMLGAAVAIAAHGRTWSTHAGQSGWSARAFALIVIVGVGFVALLLTRTIWRHRSSRLTWPVGVATLGPVILLTLALTVVALLWHRVSTPRCTPHCDRFLGSLGGGSAPSGAGGNISGAGSPGKLSNLKSVHSHTHPTSLILLWVALAVLIVAVAIWIWHSRLLGGPPRVRRRRTRLGQPSQPLTEEPTADDADPVQTTTRYIEASLDDLRREPDLRRAIIACYARMEQLFAHIGRPREGWETPFEFLRRIGPETRKPLDQLTVLYEEAQFSPHPLDEQRRTEAITALTTLRNQLRTSPV